MRPASGPGPEPPAVVPLTASRGVGDDDGVGSDVALGAGEAADGAGLGSAVASGGLDGTDDGAGVTPALDPAVAFAVGFGRAVGRGVVRVVGAGAVGTFVGAAVGFGFGLGGFGVGVGVAATPTLSDAGETSVWSQVLPESRCAWNQYVQFPTGSDRLAVYTTPALNRVPVVCISVQLFATRTRTDAGGVPELSEIETRNVNVVAVVPLAGEAVPFSIVSGPQLRAATGPARAVPPTIKRPVNARSGTSLDRDRVRAGGGITDSVTVRA
jgi:hypothetical protein